MLSHFVGKYAVLQIGWWERESGAALRNADPYFDAYKKGISLVLPISREIQLLLIDNSIEPISSIPKNIWTVSKCELN